MSVRPLVALVLLVAATPAAAEEAELPAYLQLDGAASFPFGRWSRSPVDSEQSVFSLGPGGRVALGVAPRRSRFFTVGLEAGYVELGTSEWEERVASRGLALDAAARMWSVAATGAVSMPGRGGGDLALELAGSLGVLVPSGEERFQGSTYEYDFLRTTLAARLGARGVWRFAEAWDLWAGAQVLVAPGAVRHVEPLPSLGTEGAGPQDRRTLTSVEPGLGVRYWFGL